MSLNDERDMYGNLRSGLYSSDEALRAGGTPYDKGYEIEQKVINDRRNQFDKQMDFLLSPPSWANRPSPAFNSSHGSGGNLFVRRMLAFVLVAFSIAGIAQFFHAKFDSLYDGNYAGEDSRMVFFDTYYVPPRGSTPSHNEFKNVLLGQFKQKYGALFESGTPWERLYSDCSPKKRGCLGNPVEGFKNLRPFALNQGALLEQMCEINARYYHNTPISFLVKPSWQIKTERSNKGVARLYCVVANPNDYQAKVGTTIRMLSWTYVALGILSALFSVLLIRRLVIGKR